MINFKQKNIHKAIFRSLTLGLLAITINSGIANAAKKTVTNAAVSTLTLPSTSSLILACVIPTLLGFYKSEYGVSYGYGTAMAASSYLVLSSLASASGTPLLSGPVALSNILPTIQTFTNALKSLTASLPGFHAASLFFYGTRLNLFLLYRELCLPRFRAMRERIEERAKKQGSRWKRTPFIASCAFLYYCMMCPLLVTSRLCDGMSMTGCSAGGAAALLECSLRVLVGLTLSGFLLGAIGDLNKSLGKMMKGEDALITGGVFRFFRHPNYTGEVIGWVSSCLAAITAVAWKSAKGEGLKVWKTQGPYLLLSVLGAIGISFVLGTATAGLEYRQNEKYGDSEEYKAWVKRSWVGFTLGQSKEGDGNQESTVNKDRNEQE
jgi:steroid 5-alpha reductase family enzyme